MIFYIYAHFTMNTDDVFYIGKGCGSRCSSVKARSKFWVSVASKYGWYFSILFRGNEQECLLEERRLIAKIGRRDLQEGPLVNLTAGGDGLRNPSSETRKKM